MTTAKVSHIQPSIRIQIHSAIWNVVIDKNFFRILLNETYFKLDKSFCPILSVPVVIVLIQSTFNCFKWHFTKYGPNQDF